MNERVLRCSCCQNVLGEEVKDPRTGDVYVRLSLKVRGRRRRTYRVPRVDTVICDYCGHEGAPLPCAA